MKNKHIVFIFILTLIFGLLTKGLPWVRRNFLQSPLLRIETEKVQEIQIIQPSGAEISLEKGETGWFFRRGDRSVPVSEEAVTPVLHQLASIRGGIAAEQKFDPAGVITLKIKQPGREEVLQIGPESNDAEGISTAVYLPAHQGYYKVQGRLRELFYRLLTEPQPQGLLYVDAPTKIELYFKNDTLRVEKSGDQWRADSSLAWRAEEVENRIVQLQSAPKPEYADDFDEIAGEKDRFCTILFSSDDAPESITIHLYRTQTAQKKGYVLQAGTRPGEYFFVGDTLPYSAFITFFTGPWKEKKSN